MPFYASLPCVGGSPWGSVNSLTESGAERIEQQQKDFSKLFKSFQKLIHEIDGPQLSIASNCQRTANTGMADGPIISQKTSTQVISVFMVASSGYRTPMVYR